MTTFKDTILQMIESEEFSLNMQGILNLILEDKMNSIALGDYLKLNGIEMSYMKNESLSVIIDFAQRCLADGVLTKEEMHHIALLKLFLKVKEGDFFKYKREYEVRQILSEQLEKMYADDYIDQNEALMKTDLQGLFGLSYDEFLQIVNDVAQKSLDRGADIKKLDTFIRKDKVNHQGL